MKRKRLKFSVAIIIAFMLTVIPMENKMVTAEPNEAIVVHVIDGDTFIANVNGSEEKIRLIGVNTPESVSSDESKNCEEGRIASDFTKEHLKKGMSVYLQYDQDRKDKYGRTLAYVWLKACDYGNYDDFCNYNYGAILLENTYCEAVYYAPNGKYRNWYEKLEEENK